MKFNISDEELMLLAKQWLEEEERIRWKHDKKHNDFLDYLINLLDEELILDSDEYEYEDTPIQPNYSGEDFDELLNSFFTFIDEYAKENNIDNEFDINEDDYFTHDKYCVKIKNNFYSIKLVVGQGSYVRIEKIEDNKGYEFITYENIK